MRRPIVVAGLALGSLTLAADPLSADDLLPLRVSASALVRDPDGRAHTAALRIVVERWSSAAERAVLRDAARGGPLALDEVLGRADLGTLRIDFPESDQREVPGTTPPLPELARVIGFAGVIEREGGERRVRLVTAHTLTSEAADGGSDCRLGLVEVRFAARGEALGGDVIADVCLEFDEDGEPFVANVGRRGGTWPLQNIRATSPRRR